MDLQERAVYWAKNGVDEYGRPQLTAPVELAVRWTDENKEIIASTGESIGTSATVVVNADLSLGGLLWYGRLIDLPGTALVPEGGLMEIVSKTAGHDIKQRVQRRVVMLVFYSDKLPVVGP
jgi:hypothetical protein